MLIRDRFSGRIVARKIIRKRDSFGDDSVYTVGNTKRRVT